MRMARKADPSLKLAIEDQMRSDGMITRDSFHAFAVTLCEHIFRAQESARRRKDGILAQAEAMFKFLDRDGSDDVDASELEEGLNGSSSSSFSRLLRQLGRPIKLSDMTQAPSIRCKQFKAFISKTIDDIEKEKEALDFGNLFEQDDAAVKIQAAQRGKKARKQKKDKEEGAAATKIQAVHRGKKVREAKI
jgi:hypothetical protein